MTLAMQPQAGSTSIASKLAVTCRLAKCCSYTEQYSGGVVQRQPLCVLPHEGASDMKLILLLLLVLTRWTPRFRKNSEVQEQAGH